MRCGEGKPLRAAGWDAVTNRGQDWFGGRRERKGEEREQKEEKVGEGAVYSLTSVVEGEPVGEGTSGRSVAWGRNQGSSRRRMLNCHGRYSRLANVGRIRVKNRDVGRATAINKVSVGENCQGTGCCWRPKVKQKHV